MSIDPFFSRVYNADTYNCAHFASELWQALTGEDIAWKLGGLLSPFDQRTVRPRMFRDFTRLAQPESPCLVIMVRPRTPSHVGVYYEGRVAHITGIGVHYQPVDVASMCFQVVRYYK